MALAAAARKVLAEADTGPGTPDPWLAAYGWDAIADRIAETLGS
jgi:hypothetical protein